MPAPASTPAPAAATSATTSATTPRTGLALGAGAYLIWGVLPLYFPLLAPAGAVEIIGHRIVWSLVFCLVLLAVTRGWAPVRAAFGTPRTLGLLSLGAALIAVNWTVYVYAVLTDQVVDAALGYFINPLVTVLLAVFVLSERLRPAQWVALGYLIWLGTTGAGSFGTHGTWHDLALASSGIVTAIPLLMFSAAARRLPLSVIGMLQYITPTMQFLLGVLVLGEQMPVARWWGFALVWVALVILTADGVRNGRANALARRTRAAA